MAWGCRGSTGLGGCGSAWTEPRPDVDKERCKGRAFAKEGRTSAARSEAEGGCRRREEEEFRWIACVCHSRSMWLHWLKQGKQEAWSDVAASWHACPCVFVAWSVESRASGEPCQACMHVHVYNRKFCGFHSCTRPGALPLVVIAVGVLACISETLGVMLGPTFWIAGLSSCCVIHSCIERESQ